MDKALQNLASMSETVNYNNWLYGLIRPFIGRRILEIGCGMGSMTKFLLSYELVVSIDTCPDCIQIMRSKFSHYSNLRIVNQDICDEQFDELRKFNFDTIVCISVLEHIKDDLRALRNCHKLLSRGGRFILFAPALKMLYGTIDQADGHYRRYTKPELTNKLRDSGFLIKKGTYVNFLGIFPWVLHSKILKKSLHPPKQMRFFDKLVPFCVFWEKLFQPPVGLNLLFICEKDSA